jgi:hypothetical protein
MLVGRQSNIDVRVVEYRMGTLSIWMSGQSNIGEQVNESGRWTDFTKSTARGRTRTPTPNASIVLRDQVTAQGATRTSAANHPRVSSVATAPPPIARRVTGVPLMGVSCTNMVGTG